MADKTVYLTHEGFEELEKELDYLEGSRRLEIAKMLRDALDEGGDLLENTTFMEVKAEQAFVEGRIDQLKTLLSRVRFIESPASGAGAVVSLGSEVTVQEDGYPSETFFIVGSAEADPRHGRLSDQSPLGRALLNQRVGDVVRIHAPDGEFTYRILAVR